MLPQGITIGIPNWNHEYLLPRSVGSALRAARFLRAQQIEAEVLVADDCSRDGSQLLLRQFEALYWEEGFRAMILPSNGGPAFARNHLLLNASHRYVLFLDADNEVLAENLLQFYRAITQTQAAVVYGNLIVHRGNPEEPYLVSHESFQTRIFDANYVDTFALVDRWQVLDSGGLCIEELCKGREDWELYLHLAAEGRRVVYVPLVIGTYHGLPGSLILEKEEIGATNVQRQHRVFNQLGLRGQLPLNTRHLRYHPDLGYF